MNPYPQVVHIFTIPVIVLVIVALFLPFHTLAAVIKQTGDPTDIGSMNGYMQGQTTVSPSDGLSHIFGAMKVFAIENADSGSPIYFRIKNLSTGSFVDCRTDYLNRASIPTPGSQTGGPAAQGVGTLLTLDFTGTGCTSTAGHAYFVYIVSDASPTSTGLPDIYIGGNTMNGEGSIIVSDTPFPPDEGSCLDGDFGSCINTVDPEDGDVIATSSLPYLFEIDGYLDASDYEEGARVMIKIDRNTDQQAQGALLAWDSAFGNKTFIELTSSGSFDVSTSTDAINENLDFPMDRTGLYRARWEIQSPKFNVLGFSFAYSTIESYNTRFTIGTTTAIDNIQIDQEDYLQGIIDSLEGDPLAACQFSLFDSALDFSLGGLLLDCMGGVLHWLFVLPAGVLESTVEQLKDGFLTRVPWGYFTRIVSAVQGGAEGSLPTVHADIPIGPSDDISIEFDIDDMVEGAATLTDSFESPTGSTAREILEPIIQLIVGLLVLMFIYKDIVRSAGK